MTLQVRRRSERRRMPWQNGGGITFEVAREPDDGDFDWRISMADVAGAGPFSALPGVDRVIALVEGEWMALTIDGQRHLLPPRQLLSFSGDSLVSCEVPGASRDLNVMTRRGRASAAVEMLQPTTPDEVTPCGADLVALVCLNGPVRVVTGTDAATDLDTFDSALCTGAGPISVSGGGTLAVARIWTKSRA
jgi:environmental stress-induced protein Ves